MCRAGQIKMTRLPQSKTLVAKKHFGDSIKIYHGSVGSMPFDTELYRLIHRTIKVIFSSQLLQITPAIRVAVYYVWQGSVYLDYSVIGTTESTLDK